MKDVSPEARANVEELIRVIREHLADLRERYGVESLGIFGSYVRGKQREDSDLDILVEFFRTPDLFEFVALKHELSDLLGVNVDLVMKDALKPRIGKRILQEVVEV
jgi:predicted nucleotidyltransferase